MGSVTFSIGSDTATTNYNVAPSYPYTPRPYTSVAGYGDSVQTGTARIGSTVSILDYANVPQTLGDLTVAQWATGGYSVFVANMSGYLNVNWDLPASAFSANTQSLIKAITSGTNNFEVLRLGGTPTGSTQPSFLSGVITAEPPAGVIVNGVGLYGSTGGGSIGPLTMRGFPGSASIPPGEIFMIDAWRLGGIWYFNQIELDGRINGVAAASSPFGHNYVTAGSVLNYSGVYVHHVKFGHGITHYMNQGVTFNHTGTRFDQIAGASFNIEQCGGSTFNLNNFVFGVSSTDIICDATNGFATVTVTDPQFTDGRTDGKLHVRCNKNYSYGLPGPTPSTQLDGNGVPRGITLIQNGVSRPDNIVYTVK
jgi:hypothetical protein